MFEKNKGVNCGNKSVDWWSNSCTVFFFFFCGGDVYGWMLENFPFSCHEIFVTMWNLTQEVFAASVTVFYDL